MTTDTISVEELPKLARPIHPDDLQELRKQYFDEATKKIGLTQQELADKIGVSLSTVKNWESGDAVPNADALADLCDLYQTELYFSHKKKHPLLAERQKERQKKLEEERSTEGQ